MSLVKSPFAIVDEAEASGKAGLLSRRTSWPRVKVGKLVSIQNGAAFSSSMFSNEQSGMPLIRIRDVGSNKPITYFSGDFAEAYIVEQGDLLVGMDGDFRLARWTGPRGLLNQRVCRLVVTSPELDERFLEYILPGYLDAIWRETSAVTVKHLSSRTISEIPIPLPPLDEQTRIVEILEEQLSRLEAGSLGLLKTERLLSRQLASVLAKEVSRSSAHPKVQLKALGKWVTGATPPTADEANFGTDVPFVTPGDVNYGEKILSSRRHISQAGADKVRQLPPNSVQLVSIGATLGKVGWSEDSVATNQQIHSLVPDPLVAIAEYVSLYLAAPQMQALLWESSSSTTVPILNKSRLESIEGQFPPISEQKRFLADFARLRDSLDRMNTVVAISSERASALRRSLLHAAFSGRLTDESAFSELQARGTA